LERLTVGLGETAAANEACSARNPEDMYNMGKHASVLEFLKNIIQRETQESKKSMKKKPKKN
jgi:hypothetical protein